MSLVEREVALSPAGAVVPSWPSVWFPLHEGRGSVLSEIFFGNTPLTMQGGALGASGRYGAVKPNKSVTQAPQYATTGVDGIRLAPVFSLDGMQGQQLLVGFELETEISVSAGGLLWWGQTGPGGPGGWGLRLMEESTRPLALVIRGVAASNAVVHRLRGSTPKGANSRAAYVVDMIGLSSTQLSVRIYVLPFKPRTSDPQRATREPVDPAGSGVSPPTWDGACGLTLFAQRLSVDQVDAPLSGAWMSNVWAQRRSAIDESLGQRCCLDMVTSPREFPISLRVR